MLPVAAAGARTQSPRLCTKQGVGRQRATPADTRPHALPLPVAMLIADAELRQLSPRPWACKRTCSSASRPQPTGLDTASGSTVSSWRTSPASGLWAAKAPVDVAVGRPAYSPKAAFRRFQPQGSRWREPGLCSESTDVVALSEFTRPARAGMLLDLLPDLIVVTHNTELRTGGLQRA